MNEYSDKCLNEMIMDAPLTFFLVCLIVSQLMLFFVVGRYRTPTEGTKGS